MTLVFVSHANTDKPALRSIVQALIDAKLRVWLDDPLALGYSHEQIQMHFAKLDAGLPWREQIANGLNAAHCIIGCGTRAFLDRYHVSSSGADEDSVVRDEVRHNRTKLVLCRMDAVPIADYPDALKPLHTIDLHERIKGVRLTEVEKIERLKDLVDCVSKVAERVEQAIARLRGEFHPKEEVRLTDEQRRSLLLMMNRDSHVHDLVNRCGPVMIACGDSNSRLTRLASRLVQFELPMRAAERSQELNDHSARVEALLRGINAVGRSWVARAVSWPAADYNAEDVSSFVLEQIEEKVGATRGAQTDGLMDVLRAGRANYFFQTEFTDRLELRGRNWEIISNLVTSLSRLDPERFRLLIMVTRVSVPEGSETTESWLRGLSLRVASLGGVYHGEMRPWEHLANAVANRTLQDIEDDVEAIYPSPDQDKAFKILEAEMDKIVRKWPARVVFEEASGCEDTPVGDWGDGQR